MLEFNNDVRFPKCKGNQRQTENGIDRLQSIIVQNKDVYILLAVSSHEISQLNTMLCSTLG